MDLQGITWAGNILQKFEVICLEVEEVMYRDTVEYLENQVQTVGASVKKFYSEVMEDILPPPHSDPVKVTTDDLALDPYSHTEVIKKPKRTIKRDPKNIKMKQTEDNKMVGEINAEHAETSGELDDAANHAPISFGDIGIKVCSDLYSEKRKNGRLYRRPTPTMSGTGTHDSDLPSEISKSANPESSSFHQISRRFDVQSASVEAYDSREATDISCNRVLDVNLCTSNATIDSSASDTTLSVNTKVLSVVNSSKSTDADSNSEMSPQTGSKIAMTKSESVPEEFMMPFEGRSDSSIMDAVTNDIELEIIDHLAESKFEETCVLVEGNELHIVPEKEGKQKSYKKKILEAFPLKMKSTRKQEYEKLAAQHSAQASKLEQTEQLAPANAENSNSKRLQAQYLPESEWELL